MAAAYSHFILGNLQPSGVVPLAKALNGPVPFTLAAATLHQYIVKEVNPVRSCW